jgi:DMSO/TMAO reductase YedYZ molybdopterin-dependent catalytic subunit
VTTDTGGVHGGVEPTSEAAGLRVVSTQPFNAETPLETLRGVVTPTETHFVRSHFAVPDHPGVLIVDGGVGEPLTLTLEGLLRRPATSLVTTIECAGNGRAFLDPPAPGEPWRLGAVGTAEWTGVPLQALLDEAGIATTSVEILFRGADEGTPAGLGRTIAFERSLPLPVPADALVAHAMNGRGLPPDHGAPFRLVVPGWYGMASVKWLTHVQATATPFRGFYQADRYVIGETPLSEIAPRALIVSPGDGSRVVAGPGVVRGYAWSGRTSVARVEVSLDGGSSWSPATLDPAIGRAWRRLELAWEPRVAGPAVLLARAIDARGERQPLEQVRNDLGYRNNAAQPVTVEVVPVD